MWKKHKLVMLPTEKANDGIVKSINHPLLGIYQTGDDKYNQWVGQNLYILSDDEIKEGGKLYHPRLGIGKAIIEYETLCFHIPKIEGKGSLTTPLLRNVPESKKVIATTDSDLTISLHIKNVGKSHEDIQVVLPQPSQQFIQHFIDEYNKGNVISDVMVEYERMYLRGGAGKDLDSYELKVNENNTINIKTIKNSWNIDEVEDIHVVVVKQGCLYEGGSWSDEHEKLVRLEFNKWVEENL